MLLNERKTIAEQVWGEDGLFVLIVFCLQCLVHVCVEMWGGKLHVGLCFKGEGFVGHINLTIYNMDEVI